ncbi:hypothetical protein SGPA1_20803 [Streptomyces misionensis JCM 4497]
MAPEGRGARRRSVRVAARAERRSADRFRRLPGRRVAARQHLQLHGLQPARQLHHRPRHHPRHPGDVRQHPVHLPEPAEAGVHPLSGPVRGRAHRAVRPRKRHRLARRQLGLQHPQHRHRARGMGGPALLFHQRPLRAVGEAHGGDLRQVRHPQEQGPHPRPLRGPRHRPYRSRPQLGLGALHQTGQLRLTRFPDRRHTGCLSGHGT